MVGRGKLHSQKWYILPRVLCGQEERRKYFLLSSFHDGQQLLGTYSGQSSLRSLIGVLINFQCLGHFLLETINPSLMTGMGGEKLRWGSMALLLHTLPDTD